MQRAGNSTTSTEDFAETNNLADKETARLIAMIGMWYNEAGKYNVLPIDSRGTQRIAEERPQIAISRDRYVLYPGHAIDTGVRPRRKYSTGRTPSLRKSRFRRTAPRACCSAWAATTAASRSTCKTGKLCFVAQLSRDRSLLREVSDTVPAGRHFLSMEFAPTGKPDVKNGKGAPGP